MSKYYIGRVAIAVLRREASDRAEITSQLLFGDRVELLEVDGKWCKVLTHHDQYEGWVDEKQIAQVTEEDYFNEDQFKYISPAQDLNKLEDDEGNFYYLAPGSTIPFFVNGICSFAGKTYKVNFNPIIPNSSSFQDEVERIARFYTNAPYLWGGRSLFGIDCSGFCQMVYKLCGMTLRRDAYQQAEQGIAVDFLTEAKLGDLAFFDNEEGRITHVGMMLNNHQIIHSAGRVHVDPIDNQGIYSQELGRYTHKLRIIKRF